MKKLKRLLSMLFALCMVLVLIPAAGAARHVHNNGYYSKGYCSDCGAWLPIREYVANFLPTYYKVASGKTAYMRTLPYQASNEHIGHWVRALKSGTRVIVTESVVNGLGNTWHKVWYDGVEGYIVADKLVWDGDVPQTVSISNERSPSGTLTKGRGFGLRGVIDSETAITNVTACVYDAHDVTATPKLMYQIADTIPDNAKRYNIQYDGVNDGICFNRLGAGDYTYVVKITNANGPWPIIVKDFSIR